MLIAAARLTHEYHVTPVCGGETKLSCNPGRNVGSKCPYIDANAVPNPTTTAACGAHALRVNTMNTAIVIVDRRVALMFAARRES